MATLRSAMLGRLTTVVVEEVLLPGFGSCSTDATAALLVTVPVTVVLRTATTMVTTTLLPLATEPNSQSTFVPNCCEQLPWVELTDSIWRTNGERSSMSLTRLAVPGP